MVYFWLNRIKFNYDFIPRSWLRFNGKMKKKIEIKLFLEGLILRLLLLLLLLLLRFNPEQFLKPNVLSNEIVEHIFSYSFMFSMMKLHYSRPSLFADFFAYLLIHIGKNGQKVTMQKQPFYLQIQDSWSKMMGCIYHE